MRRGLLALCLTGLLLLTCCSSTPDEPTPPPTTDPPATEAPTTEETAPPTTEPDVAVEKEFVVYFANWYLDSKTAEEGAEVCSIPWDKVTYINHAFWEVQPADGSTETSWEQREQGKEPRKAFRIASTLPEADFEDQTPSQMAQGLPRNHFAQYAVYAEKYPQVNVLISIGGYTNLSAQAGGKLCEGSQK